jgi:hypothetical protein
MCMRGDLIAHSRPPLLTFQMGAATEIGLVQAGSTSGSARPSPLPLVPSLGSSIRAASPPVLATAAAEAARGGGGGIDRGSVSVRSVTSDILQQRTDTARPTQVTLVRPGLAATSSGVGRRSDQADSSNSDGEKQDPGELRQRRQQAPPNP